MWTSAAGAAVARRFVGSRECTMAAGPCAGPCGTVTAESSHGIVRPQAVGLRCTGRGVCVNAAVAGLARIHGHVGGRFRSGLDPPLDGAARRRQGGRQTSERATGSGAAWSYGSYGSWDGSDWRAWPSGATKEARCWLLHVLEMASLLIKAVHCTTERSVVRM